MPSVRSGSSLRILFLAVAFSSSRPHSSRQPVDTHVPAGEWKLEAVSGAVYHIVSKLSGTPIIYDGQNPKAPLVISKNQTFPAEWTIDPVGGGMFTVSITLPRVVSWKVVPICPGESTGR
ncbi:hypothetical protein C8R44DRAFT_787951 [Mycena epipterygia]|nr:hypothetical protein C8R44DRAFT_787951 [Mycena epipterygia]